MPILILGKHLLKSKKETEGSTRKEYIYVRLVKEQVVNEVRVGEFLGNVASVSVLWARAELFSQQ